VGLGGRGSHEPGLAAAGRGRRARAGEGAAVLPGVLEPRQRVGESGIASRVSDRRERILESRGRHEYRLVRLRMAFVESLERPMVTIERLGPRHLDGHDPPVHAHHEIDLPLVPPVGHLAVSAPERQVGVDRTRRFCPCRVRSTESRPSSRLVGLAMGGDTER